MSELSAALRGWNVRMLDCVANPQADAEFKVMYHTRLEVAGHLASAADTIDRLLAASKAEGEMREALEPQAIERGAAHLHNLVTANRQIGWDKQTEEYRDNMRDRFASAVRAALSKAGA